jgi:S-adenosylmethionine hydrolase
MKISPKNKQRPIVTLLTDFGEAGGYAGSVKGVIMSLAPRARVVDITHCISPYDISSGAYVLSTYYKEFPGGTVHLAVVDPGVGAGRKPIAVKCAGHLFVAPDNGLLSFVLAGGEKYKSREITPPAGARVSGTFHGRDIFAPAAAHLANGGKFSGLGPELKTVHFIDNITPSISGNTIVGKVIHIDRFGNLITNIREESLTGKEPSRAVVRIASLTISGLSGTYSDKKTGEPVAYIGSSGYLEIGIVESDAASATKSRGGREVTVALVEKSAARGKK